MHAHCNLFQLILVLELCGLKTQPLLVSLELLVLVLELLLLLELTRWLGPDTSVVWRFRTLTFSTCTLKAATTEQCESIDMERGLKTQELATRRSAYR